jgi:putative permease
MQKKSLRNQNILRHVFFFFVIILSLTVIINIPRITVPLALSYILYLITCPIYEKLLSAKIPSIVANFFIVFSLIFIIVSPLSSILPLIEDQSQNFDNYIPRSEFYIKKYYFEFKVLVEKKTTYKIPDNFLLDLLNTSKGYFKEVALEIPKILGSILEWALIIPLLLFFMLRDGRSFKRLVLKITPNSIFEKFYTVGHQFNKKLGGYMLAKFFEASLIGVMISSALSIAGVDFALILGLIAAVTNIIPYVGPVLGSIPGLVIVLAKYGPGNLFYIAFFIYLIANLVDLAIIFPILVSKIVDLHPVVVVLSVILGSQYFGLVGMVISIPCAAAVKLITQVLFEEFYLS